MTLDECRAAIGQRVVYGFGGRQEWGEITTVNQRYVFVLYDGDRTAKATHPEDLRRA